MSQHDMDVAAGSGAAVRADINLALQALASNNSGATEPATPYAFMLWADTANDLLKQRNAANTDWINKGKLSAALVDETGATFAGPVLFNTVADIASAATIDLTAYGSGAIATVTGASGTSAFTMNDGQHMTLVAAGAWSLANTAGTCEIIDGADFVCAAGDVVKVFKTGGVVTVEPPRIIRRNISFSANKGGTNQTGVATATFTKVTFGAEEWDTAGKFASSTYTPGKLGKHRLDASFLLNSGTYAPRLILSFYKNGVAYRTVEGSGTSAGTANMVQGVSGSVLVNVTNVADYFDVYVYQNSGGDRVISGIADVTFFEGHYLEGSE